MITGNAKSEVPDEGVLSSIPKVVLDPIKEAYSLKCNVISMPSGIKNEEFMVDLGIVFDRNNRTKIQLKNSKNLTISRMYDG